MTQKTKRFGKYRLLEKIGVGGMAEVYKAEYLQTKGSPIAIKRILADLSRDKKLISMLINEAKLAMTLKHPNIVPIYDFGLVDDHYFIAMEYIDGTDVRSLLKRAYSENEKIPLDAVFHIMVSVLDGLYYAHTKRDNFNKSLEIIHRDVSPQNIMISYTGEVKILDFGIAKAKGSHFEIAKAKGSLTETQAGILKGKFSYMSPEQARGKNLDQRSDIFSAGIVLWELLTVQSLFGGSTEIKIIEKVRKAKIQNPADKNPQITKDITRIVYKALSKSRWRRYQTAEQFKNQLLLWGYKNGLLINNDFMREYIIKQFPAGSSPATFTIEVAGSVVEQTDNSGISKIAQDIASEVGGETGNQETISEITDGPRPNSLNESRETHLEPLSSLPNMERSYTEEPSYTIKAKVKKLLNAKTIFAFALVIALVFVLLNIERLTPDIPSAKSIYNYTVLIPREAIRKVTSKKRNEPALAFNPKDIVKTGKTIFFDRQAEEYILSLPLKRHDRLRNAINVLFEVSPDGLQKCKSRNREYNCAFLDGHRINYSTDSAAGTITVSSVIPLRK